MLLLPLFLFFALDDNDNDDTLLMLDARLCSLMRCCRVGLLNGGGSVIAVAVVTAVGGLLVDFFRATLWMLGQIATMFRGSVWRREFEPIHSIRSTVRLVSRDPRFRCRCPLTEINTPLESS